MRRVTGSAAHDRAAESTRADALLAIGLDNLPLLEELFGDALGDEVLAAVERRVRAALPQGCTLGTTRHRRLLLGLPASNLATARMIFDALQAAASNEAIETAHGPVAVTLSGGCALADAAGRGGVDIAEALQFVAFGALHAAMARGAGSFEVARDRDEARRLRARLLHTVRAAVGAGCENRLGLAFQPVVRASGSNVISFHECLVRLRQPDGGLLRAGEFMPEIERMGLAPFVDRQVLRHTFAVLARHPAARFSINVFPQTMHDRQWMALFEEGAGADPTLAERLIVEVTETGSMLDPERTRAFMERLRGRGVSFALDDFGAGHTALHYLRDFRFDILKIDGRFVRDIEPGSDNAFLVERMVEIARRFEMMTVAEAVQSPAEARCLSELGIEHFQGFHFGCPSLMLGPTAVPMPAVAAQA